MACSQVLVGRVRVIADSRRTSTCLVLFSSPMKLLRTISLRFLVSNNLERAAFPARPITMRCRSGQTNHNKAILIWTPSNKIASHPSRSDNRTCIVLPGSNRILKSHMWYNRCCRFSRRRKPSSAPSAPPVDRAKTFL